MDDFNMAKKYTLKYQKGSNFFGKDDVLLLDGMLYELKQAAMGLWKEFLKVHKQMGNGWSRADPCFNYN